MRVERVGFFSDGAELCGDLHLPDGAGPFPVVVRCQGWGAERRQGLGDHLKLIDSGYALLAFDFRGYGESAGTRNRLFPLEMAADIRAAVAFLRGHASIDAERVALLGVLTGAAAGIHAMSEDASIAAAICIFPFGDGSRWMRAIRRPWEWRRFLDRIDTDRVARAISGGSEAVDPNEILIRDPESLENEMRLRSKSEARSAWRLGLDSAEAILAFRPESVVDRLGGRPVMCVAVEDDAMIPAEESMMFFETIPGPKRMILLRGITHYQIYEPSRVELLNAEFVGFLRDAFAAKNAEREVRRIVQPNM